jgi:NAD-dependent deacetylase
VTQNVDGLHQQAGSTEVLELHGTIRRAHCHRCGTSRPMADAVAESSEAPPRCACGGLFRPSVVWFGESLPEEILAAACEAAESCDLFLSVGTSSTVYPAAGLIELAARNGACVIEINPEPTPLSRLADLCLRGPAGRVLPAFATLVEDCRWPEATST